MTSVDIPSAPTGISLNPLNWRRAWLGMDRSEAIQLWAQTAQGQIILHLAFAAILFTNPLIRTNQAALLGIALVLCALFPARRMMLLSVLGTAYFLIKPFKQEPFYHHFSEIWAGIGANLPGTVGFVGFGLVFLVFAFVMVINQTSRKVEMIARYPIRFLLALGSLLAAATVLLPQSHAAFSASWIFLSYLTGSFFFLGYVLLDSRSKSALPPHQQLGFVRPVWGYGHVPLKGPAFLRKFEAKTATDLAVTRLKAIKLAVWAVILFWLWEIAFNRVLFGALQLPQLDTAIAAGAAGVAEAPLTRWMILAADFLAQIIIFGATIHIFVAVIRMLGFNIPRGMARPLSSRTMSEFWARYLFYFKEILADFFFYPTFQRYFKNHPKLRLAFATFMAAFVGNVLFDLIAGAPSFAITGFWPTIEAFYSYVIYAGALTAGLIWSQIAKKKPTAQDGWLRYEVIPRIQVLIFYALLQVFDDTTGAVPVGERIDFFFSLFGVTP